MRDADLADFGSLLDAVCGLLSRGQYAPNATNTALWFRALAAHDLATVRAAFDAHIRDPQRGRFVPTPADILGHIEAAVADDGRPEPDEAWAMALRARDEAATVVWCAEIAEAWGICLPVLCGGDEVGARVAFKAAYARLIREARASRRPAAWTPSLGSDSAQRAVALRAAVDAGRLPRSAAAALPQQQPAGLLELAQAKGIPAEVRAQLLTIREALTKPPEEQPELPPDRLATVAAKQRTAEAVKRYAAQQQGEAA